MSITPRQAKELLAYRKTNEKYRYYVPNGKVEEFITKLSSDEIFILLFSAANGVGKTAAGTNILANLMFPCGNPWFQGPLFQNWPYLKRGRIVSDPTTVEGTLVPELINWFPTGRYQAKKGRRPFYSQWKTDTGWSFDVMTYDQQVKEFESANLGWCWFDEPPPEDVFKATVARMRKGGIIFITATPLTGSAWMYDQIVVNPLEGQRMAITADVEANCKEHGVRGILNHRDIERMIAEYDEDDKQARVKGLFQHLRGLIYKMFTPEIHIIEPFRVTHEDFVVIEALDSHPRNPDAVVWMAVDRAGTKYIVDEFYDEVEGTEDLAQNILSRAANYRVIKRVLEPGAFVKDQHQDRDLATQLEDDFDLEYEPATKARTAAISRTKQALNFRRVDDHILKPPELYVFSTCTRTIWEFQHWQWNEWTGKTAEKRDKSEKPQDKNDHQMENVGRLLMEEPVWVPMPKKKRYTGSTENVELDPYD